MDAMKKYGKEQSGAKGINKNKYSKAGNYFCSVEIKMNECEVMFFLSWMKSTRQKTGQADVHFTRVCRNEFPACCYTHF